MSPKIDNVEDSNNEEEVKKVRFKIVINWKGEVHEFYRYAVSADQAFHYAVRKLAKKVGYSTKMVREYVMDPRHRRWECN